MRSFAPAYAFKLCFILGGLGVFSAAGVVSGVSAQTPGAVTASTIDRWMVELSNWDRWGADDELGTLNLIIPEKRIEAGRLIRDGISVSLSHDYIKRSAADVSPPSTPWEHEIIGIGGSGNSYLDRFSVAYHGFAHSHMDAWCHILNDQRMYNGYAHTTVTADEGCTRGGVTVAKDGIVTRGVLMDIARLEGVDYLEPGTAIHVEHLEAWEAESGVRVGEGDVLLVRTGRWARRAELGPFSTSQAGAGLHASVAPWLKERGVAMLGSDYINDVLPTGIEGAGLPIHRLALVAMGMPLFDNLDLEALGQEASERERWEFMLVAAPLAVPGGTGSPLNPIAIF